MLEIHLSKALDVDTDFVESEEIEFTLYPAKVRDDADFYRVLVFILHLGRVLGRTVHMTVESPGERPPDYLRYDPLLDRVVRPPQEP